MEGSPGAPLRKAVLTSLPGAGFQAMSVFPEVYASPRRRNIAYQSVGFVTLKVIVRVTINKGQKKAINMDHQAKWQQQPAFRQC